MLLTAASNDDAAALPPPAPLKEAEQQAALPPASLKDIPQRQRRKGAFLRCLRAGGWRLVRISGSHHIHVKAGRRCIPVVVHDGFVKPVAALKILRQIMREEVSSVAEQASAAVEEAAPRTAPRGRKSDEFRAAEEELLGRIQEEDERDRARLRDGEAQLQREEQDKQQADLRSARDEIDRVTELMQAGRYDEALQTLLRDGGGSLQDVGRRVQDIEQQVLCLSALARMERALMFGASCSSGAGAGVGQCEFSTGSPRQIKEIEQAFTVARKASSDTTRMALEQLFLTRYLEQIYLQAKTPIPEGAEDEDPKLIAAHRKMLCDVRQALKLILRLIDRRSNSISAEHVFHVTITILKSGKQDDPWYAPSLVGVDGVVHDDPWKDEADRPELITFAEAFYRIFAHVLMDNRFWGVTDGDGADASLDVDFLEQVRNNVFSMPIFRIMGARYALNIESDAAHKRFVDLLDEEILPAAEKCDAASSSMVLGDGMDDLFQLCEEKGGPGNAWRAIILQKFTTRMALNDIEKVEVHFLKSALGTPGPTATESPVVGSLGLEFSREVDKKARLQNAEKVDALLCRLENFDYGLYIEKTYELKTIDMVLGLLHSLSVENIASSLKGIPLELAREVFAARTYNVFAENTAKATQFFSKRREVDCQPVKSSLLIDFHYLRLLDDGSIDDKFYDVAAGSVSDCDAAMNSRVGPSGGGGAAPDGPDLSCDKKITLDNKYSGRGGFVDMADVIFLRVTRNKHQAKRFRRDGDSAAVHGFKYARHNWIEAARDGIELVVKLQDVDRILVTELGMASLLRIGQQAGASWVESSSRFDVIDVYNGNHVLPFRSIKGLLAVVLTTLRDFSDQRRKVSGATCSLGGHRSLWVWSVMVPLITASTSFFDAIHGTGKRLAESLPQGMGAQMTVAKALRLDRKHRQECDQIFMALTEFYLQIEAMLDHEVVFADDPVRYLMIRPDAGWYRAWDTLSTPISGRLPHLQEFLVDLLQYANLDASGGPRASEAWSTDYVFRTSGNEFVAVMRPLVNIFLSLRSVACFEGDAAPLVDYLTVQSTDHVVAGVGKSLDELRRGARSIFPGQRGLIQNLRQRPELNGREAIVLRVPSTSTATGIPDGRIQVWPRDGSSGGRHSLSLKSENFIPMTLGMEVMRESVEAGMASAETSSATSGESSTTAPFRFPRGETAFQKDLYRKLFAHGASVMPEVLFGGDLRPGQQNLFEDVIGLPLLLFMNPLCFLDWDVVQDLDNRCHAKINTILLCLKGDPTPRGRFTDECKFTVPLRAPFLIIRKVLEQHGTGGGSSLSSSSTIPVGTEAGTVSKKSKKKSGKKESKEPVGDQLAQHIRKQILKHETQLRPLVERLHEGALHLVAAGRRLLSGLPTQEQLPQRLQNKSVFKDWSHGDKMEVLLPLFAAKGGGLGFLFNYDDVAADRFFMPDLMLSTIQMAQDTDELLRLCSECVFVEMTLPGTPADISILLRNFDISKTWDDDTDAMLARLIESRLASGARTSSKIAQLLANGRAEPPVMGDASTVELLKVLAQRSFGINLWGSN